MQKDMHIPRNVEGGDSCPDNTKHQIHFCCNSLVDSGENAGWAYINWIVFCFALVHELFYLLYVRQLANLVTPSRECGSVQVTDLPFTQFYSFHLFSFPLVPVGKGFRAVEEQFSVSTNLTTEPPLASVCAIHLAPYSGFENVVKLSKYDEREDFKTFSENSH